MMNIDQLTKKFEETGGGDEYFKAYAEQTLTLGELKAFIAGTLATVSDDTPILVNGESCPSLALCLPGNGIRQIELLSKSKFTVG